VGARATFVQADLFESDFSKAQVITMFLLPSINMKLRPTILDLAPGTRVVSNTFTMEWPPKSGRMAEFPEVDRAEWFTIEAARTVINSAQATFLDRLVTILEREQGI